MRIYICSNHDADLTNLPSHSRSTSPNQTCINLPQLISSSQTTAMNVDANSSISGSQSDFTDPHVISCFEMRERARKHYESKGKSVHPQSGLIGPWTPKEMQEDRPSGGWADGHQGGESCCPRQSPDADWHHEFWICSDCYYDRFTSNARWVDFQKSFQAWFEHNKLENSNVDELSKASEQETDADSRQAGEEAFHATNAGSAASTVRSDAGGSNGETL